MPKLAFQRVVREVAYSGQAIGSELRFTREAIDTLQEITEQFIADLMTGMSLNVCF